MSSCALTSSSMAAQAHATACTFIHSSMPSPMPGVACTVRPWLCTPIPGCTSLCALMSYIQAMYCPWLHTRTCLHHACAFINAFLVPSSLTCLPHTFFHSYDSPHTPTHSCTL